jgi:predicted hotdog family 3-hydroxylacyl-ACP dehydratase
MCCIERLLSSSETAAVAEVTLTPAHSLMNGDALDKAGYVELAAQTAGAMQGFDLFRQGLPLKFGYLVGAQDFIFHRGARAGDTLTIKVTLEAELGEVSVLSSRILLEEELLAEGRLKVYVPEE